MISCVKVKVGNSISILMAGKFSSYWRARLDLQFGWTSIVVVEVVGVESSLETSPVVVIIVCSVLVVGVVLVLQRPQTRLVIVSQTEGETDDHQDTGRYQHLE